jgi:MFS family permease
MTTALKTSDGPAGASSVRYKVMTFLCVLSFLTYFDRICIQRVQGEVQGEVLTSNVRFLFWDLGPDQQMGLIFGTFWFAYGVFEIPAGWLGDRYGARVTLTRIVLAWSVLTALTGMATGFWSLLLIRFLFGAGEAGAYPNMARVQAAWLPPQTRAKFGGLLWLVARWGGAFSPLLFGTMVRWADADGFRNAVAGIPVLSAFADISAWRTAFVLAGLLGVVWCVFFYPWFRDDPADRPEVNAAELAVIRAGRTEPGAGDAHRTPPGMWKGLFTCPSLWAMGCLYIFGSFGWSFFITWMPRYLQEVHHLPYEKSESPLEHPLFWGGVSCLVGGWTCDWLVRRTGRKRLCRMLFPISGYLIGAAALFAIPYVQTPGQAIALACLASAGHDFGQGANWATIVDIGGRYAGTAAGFNNMIGNLGNFIGPQLGAFLFANVSWNAAIGVYAGAFFCAAAMWLFINPDKKFYREEGEKAEG